MPSIHDPLRADALVALLNALQNSRVIDLSQTLEEHMPHYPTHSKFFHNLWGCYWHGDRALTHQLVMNEHSGTHVDAPVTSLATRSHRPMSPLRASQFTVCWDEAHGSIAGIFVRAGMSPALLLSRGKRPTARCRPGTSCSSTSVGRRTGGCGLTASATSTTGRA